MAVDAVTGLALHLSQDCLDTRVFDFGLAAAHGAHNMVVVDRLADDIGVVAGGQVDPLEQAQIGEQVERAEDGGPPDRDIVAFSVVEQVGCASRSDGPSLRTNPEYDGVMVGTASP